jgi:hypothetical protein
LKDDEIIASMFEEPQTGKMVNGQPRISDAETLKELEASEAKELEEALAEFLCRTKAFIQMNDPFVHMDVGRPGVEWWWALEWLALSESRLKQAFCGNDRRPQIVRQYHKWKLKMLEGKRYRTDA